MAPGTLVTGQRGTTGINADQRRIDMASETLLLEPDSAPLLVFTKNISKKKTVNPQFKWLEDELDPRFSATSATVTNSATTVNVTTGQGAYFKAQHIVYVPRTGELFRVVSISTDALTVVRGLGNSGTGVAMNSAEELLIVSTAQPEGDASKAATTRNPVTATNYTQIFRDEWDATGTELATENEGTDDWDEQALKKGIEHKKSIEYQLLVGKPDENTSSGQARRTTGGFNHFVTTNVTDAGGTMTEAELFAGIRAPFRYGSKEKLVMCSALSVDVINGFSRGKVQIMQSEKTFGVRVAQLISPHGTLNMVTHWLLEGATLGGQMWIVDPSACKYRYLENRRGSRDTAIYPNIQNNDVDGRKDEYRTECGLQFGLEKRHGKIIGITG